MFSWNIHKAVQMIVRKIDKQILLDLDVPFEGECVVEDEIVDTSRWAVQHNVVFEYEGKHYRAWYQRGATEIQDEGPWEYEDTVECTEVHSVEKLVTVWENVKNPSLENAKQ